jgi:hypothetical protein
MDLESRNRWVEYSRAKDTMFVHTDVHESPWFIVEADDKRRARINCIAHLLETVPYEDVLEPDLRLKARQGDQGYVRPPQEAYHYVPDAAARLLH